MLITSTTFRDMAAAVDKELVKVALGMNDWQALLVSGSRLTVQEVNSNNSLIINLHSTTQQHQSTEMKITVSVTSKRGTVYLFFSCPSGCVMQETLADDKLNTIVPLREHRDVWVWTPRLNETLLQVVLNIMHTQTKSLTHRNLTFRHCCSPSWTRLRVILFNETVVMEVRGISDDKLTELGTTGPIPKVKAEDQFFISFRSADTAFWSLGCDARLVNMQDKWSKDRFSQVWLWVCLAVMMTFLAFCVAIAYIWNGCKRSRGQRGDKQLRDESPHSWWNMSSVSICEASLRRRPPMISFHAPSVEEKEAVQEEMERKSSSDKRACVDDFTSGAAECQYPSGSKSSPSELRTENNIDISDETENTGNKSPVSVCVIWSSRCKTGHGSSGSSSRDQKWLPPSKDAYDNRNVASYSHKDNLDIRNIAPPGLKGITSRSRENIHLSRRHSQPHRHLHEVARSPKKHRCFKDSDKHQEKLAIQESCGGLVVNSQQHTGKMGKANERYSKKNGREYKITRKSKKNLNCSQYKEQERSHPGIPGGEVENTTYSNKGMLKQLQKLSSTDIQNETPKKKKITSEFQPVDRNLSSDQVPAIAVPYSLSREDYHQVKYCSNEHLLQKSNNKETPCLSTQTGKEAWCKSPPLKTLAHPPTLQRKAASQTYLSEGYSGDQHPRGLVHNQAWSQNLIPSKTFSSSSNSKEHSQKLSLNRAPRTPKLCHNISGSPSDGSFNHEEISASKLQIHSMNCSPISAPPSPQPHTNVTHQPTDSPIQHTKNLQVRVLPPLQHQPVSLTPAPGSSKECGKYRDKVEW
nr:uncharacterized protein LOC128687859 [Cherax quadricarinatus]